MHTEREKEQQIWNTQISSKIEYDSTKRCTFDKCVSVYQFRNSIWMAKQKCEPQQEPWEIINIYGIGEKSTQVVVVVVIVVVVVVVVAVLSAQCSSVHNPPKSTKL